MLAHSGAKIGIRDSYTVTMPSAEVPCFFPTILQQLQEFNGDPASVQWVLMNGGINDVEIQRVFNPMIPQYELELHIRNYCGRDLLAILQLATQKFPNARMLVLGYYPALSHLSRAEGVESLYSLVHGVKFAPLFDADLFRNELVEHCLRFWKLSTGLFRSGVAHVNREAGVASGPSLSIPAWKKRTRRMRQSRYCGNAKAMIRARRRMRPWRKGAWRMNWLERAIYRKTRCCFPRWGIRMLPAPQGWQSNASRRLRRALRQRLNKNSWITGGFWSKSL